MKVTSIKTDKITKDSGTIFDILDKHLKSMPENSVLAVTSKIAAIAEGRIVPTEGITKKDLIKDEADYYLMPKNNKFDYVLTIKDNILASSAGIDQSNGNGYFVLWPKDSQKSANQIRDYLKKRFDLKNIGVIITDSKATPLKRGTTGVAIAHSGFSALKNYIGEPDIFGRNLNVTKANTLEGLAVAAVLLMGEGDEQTPLALLEDLPFVEFVDHNPTKEELDELQICIEDDLFADLLTCVDWQKGGKN